MIIAQSFSKWKKKNTRKSLVIRGILIVNNIVDKVDKSSKRTNSKRKGVDKYRQKIHTERRKNQRFYVDNVDKLFSKEGFADFYDISGSHGYQQISVHTIF